jgi:WD40 repeat protein
VLLLHPTPVWEGAEYGAVKSNNFLKGCAWSPDGSCLLTASDDNCLRLFNLPAELYTAGSVPLTPHSTAAAAPTLEPTPAALQSVLQVHEAETIYDYSWYPRMSSADPATCCFVSTSRDHPMHMWDAFTGSLRCTYRAYDHLDEITAAHSTMFTPDGQRLFAGHKDCIRIFDVGRPGK